MRRPLTIAIVVSGLLLAGCGDDDENATNAAEPAAEEQAAGGPGADTRPNQPAAPEPQPEPRTGTKIKVAGSDYGEILFDGDDQAIYHFDAEQGSKAECYGDCAVAWPPVLADGKPKAGVGAKQSLLGTTKRDDGSTQVTYNGHPLYYYDEPPGVVSCHNVDQFGGLWLVVDGAGNAVE